MKRSVVLTILLLISGIAHADQMSLWKYSSNTLKPVVESWNITTTGTIANNADDSKHTFGSAGATDSYIQFGGTNLEYYSSGGHDFTAGWGGQILIGTSPDTLYSYAANQAVKLCGMNGAGEFNYGSGSTYVYLANSSYAIQSYGPNLLAGGVDLQSSDLYNVDNIYMAGAIYDGSDYSSVDPNNRYLYASDGSTVILDWSTDGTAQFGDNNIVTTSKGTLKQVDIIGGGNFIDLLIGGDGTSQGSRTNNTNKIGRYGLVHYQTAEEPMGLLWGYQSSTAAAVYFGGGTGYMNAPKNLYFYTAANATTTTGTLRLDIDGSGNFDFQSGNLTTTGNMGIGTAPSYQFHQVLPADEDLCFYINGATNDLTLADTNTHYTAKIDRDYNVGNGNTPDSIQNITAWLTLKHASAGGETAVLGASTNNVCMQFNAYNYGDYVASGASGFAVFNLYGMGGNVNTTNAPTFDSTSTQGIIAQLGAGNFTVYDATVLSDSGGNDPSLNFYTHGAFYDINWNPTINSGTWASVVRGDYIDIDAAPVINSAAQTMTFRGLDIDIDVAPVINGGSVTLVVYGIVLNPFTATGGSMYSIWNNSGAELWAGGDNVPTSWGDGKVADSYVKYTGSLLDFTSVGGFQFTGNTTVSGSVTATSFVIGGNTLTTAEWANLDGQNQPLKTTDDAQFTNIGLGVAPNASYKVYGNGIGYFYNGSIIAQLATSTYILTGSTGTNGYGWYSTAGSDCAVIHNGSGGVAYFSKSGGGSVQLGTSSNSLYATGDAYFTADVSALTFTDRTPAWKGTPEEALTAICSIRKIGVGTDAEIDHSTLPVFAQRKITVPIYEEQEIIKGKPEKTQVQIGEEIVDGRDIGATITMLVESIKALNDRIKVLEQTEVI